MNKDHYPIAFLVLIAIAVYIMYSGVLTPKIDLQQYKTVCIKYRTAAAGTYTDKEMQSLVNKVNYLFPEAVAEITDPLKKEIKMCSNDLAARLKR